MRCHATAGPRRSRDNVRLEPMSPGKGGSPRQPAATRGHRPLPRPWPSAPRRVPRALRSRDNVRLEPMSPGKGGSPRQPAATRGHRPLPCRGHRLRGGCRAPPFPGQRPTRADESREGGSPGLRGAARRYPRPSAAALTVAIGSAAGAARPPFPGQRPTRADESREGGLSAAARRYPWPSAAALSSVEERGDRERQLGERLGGEGLREQRRFGPGGTSRSRHQDPRTPRRRARVDLLFDGLGRY